MSCRTVLPLDNQSLYIQQESQSMKVLGGVVAAVVVGFVVYAGASTSTSTTLYAAPANVQTTSSVRSAMTMGPMRTPGVLAAAAPHMAAEAEEEMEYVMPSVEFDEPESNGFAVPAALASLSMGLFALAYNLLKAPQQAMAAVAVVRPPATVVDPLLTPQGYYEAYELVVVISPKCTDLEKEEELSTLEALFPKYQCKKVEKLDRGRRLLAYPIKGHIEAYVILYTFKGPRTMPKSIVDWFTAPGANANGAVLRCNTRKQRRVKKGQEGAAALDEDMAMWNI